MKTLLIEGQFQADLGKKIQSSYNKLITEVSKVPIQLYPDKKINDRGKMVSVSDIIAYQIGWGCLLLGWYAAGLEGKVPQMPGEGFAKWDFNALAKHFYHKYACDIADEQLQLFHTVVRQIISIVEREENMGNLNKLGVWAWCRLKSGKEWPLSKWIQVNTVAPYQKACRWLKLYKQDRKTQA